MYIRIVCWYLLCVRWCVGVGVCVHHSILFGNERSHEGVKNITITMYVIFVNVCVYIYVRVIGLTYK